jgi:tight adherence protein C
MAIALLFGWCGVTLVLGELRWFRRRPLAARLGPYVPGGTAASPAPRGVADVVRLLVTPVVDGMISRLSRGLGVSDEVELRLRRIHSSLTISAFRARQIGWSLAAFGSAAVLSIAVGLPPVPAVLCLIGGPLLAVLLLEQQLVNASADWQRRVFLELPVVSEQLGMLLGAGFSLGSALSRLAQRGRGCCATDLAVVCGRIRQGLPEIEALREWSRTVDVAAVTRLVGVLALNRDGGDLGRLIAEESRSVRRDAQRELIESAERRAQQVWIPVTVATLVPGVLFLAVPFIEAMRLFTSG